MIAAPAHQHGVAALAVTMLLFFVMVLGVAFVNRNLVFEQRASANQYRSTQAFEAAEAGIEWAVAQLSRNQRIGADCLPTADTAATSFRSRQLEHDAAIAMFTPTTWLDGGTVQALRSTCVRDGAGWRCSCPASGHPVVPSGTTGAAFSVFFEATGRPGLIRTSAFGCSSLGGPCAIGSTTPTDASARIQVLLGLLPSLRTAPAAALTAQGAIDADGAAFGAHNADTASGGLALHSGGAVSASLAQLSGPAGGAAPSTLAAQDSALSALTPGQFFASYFGLDKAAWARQPLVRRMTCSGDCTAALLALIANDPNPSLVFVDGDLRLAGPAVLGSSARPVAVVVNGAIRFSGDVALHGLLYGNSMTWNGVGSNAGIRGALVVAGAYQGDAAPQFVYDAAVLARLRSTGTFARVSGSWRDF
ncbi:MAG: PilX N-terminal domain-containing pilus assembly protein [Caldimonas sp.]